MRQCVELLGRDLDGVGDGTERHGKITSSGGAVEPPDPGRTGKRLTRCGRPPQSDTTLLAEIEPSSGICRLMSIAASMLCCAVNASRPAPLQ